MTLTIWNAATWKTLRGALSRCVVATEREGLHLATLQRINRRQTA